MRQITYIVHTISEQGDENVLINDCKINNKYKHNVGIV